MSENKKIRFQDEAPIENLHKILSKKYPNYVLVTCSDVNKTGKMNAQMIYSGDETLVHYLLDCAHNHLAKDN